MGAQVVEVIGRLVYNLVNMGLYLKQNDERTVLQERVAAELRRKAEAARQDDELSAKSANLEPQLGGDELLSGRGYLIVIGLVIALIGIIFWLISGAK